MRSPTTEEQLNERIKELSCLYSMSTVFLKNKPVDSTLKEICEIIKKAWQFPDEAFVSISIDTFEITTSKIPPITVSQNCNIIIFNQSKGEISVHYDATIHLKTSFLDDEQHLLEKIAVEISGFYEKHLKDAEIVLLKRSAERTDRLVLLGEITAGIAHELNTPLANILGFAELIKTRPHDSQTQQDIDKVIRAAIYSREIVKKLMFFSCEMPQHMQLIKIKPVIDQALQLLEPNFRKAGIVYDLQFGNPDLEAQLDPIQFTQVLFNILVNAIYVSPSGSVIQIKLINDKQHIYLEIADMGPGISIENRQKIFEPFFTTKPFGEGNGLGLSVVHGIIKNHRGEISIYDNTPNGTIFKIILPLIH